MNRCSTCGGVGGAHRGGCVETFDPNDKQWLLCECGNRVWLLPVRDYMVEYWASCHIRGDSLCERCPLNDINKLLEKVKERFGP